MNTAVIPFIQTPKEAVFNIFQLNLAYSFKEVLRFIVAKVYEWPETREQLEAELSLSYIERATGVHYTNVSKALKQFKEAGYIKIKKPIRKNGGRIIQFLGIGKKTTPEEERVVSVPIDKNIGKVSQNNKETEVIQKFAIKEGVVEEPTIGVADSPRKPITSSKKLTKQKPSLPTPVPSQLVSSYKNTIKENTANRNNFTEIGNILTSSIPTIRTSKEKTQPLTDKLSKNLKGPEMDTTIQEGISPELRQAQAMLEQKRAQVKKNNIQVSIPGITEKTLQVGIAKLKSRNITNIPFALEEIKSQMELQEEIKSPKAYFLSLCKKMKNFSKPVVKTAATSTKTMETINSWKEEKEKEEDPNIAFKRFTRENPEGMKEAVQAVNSSPGSRFVSGAIKLILYITEYKKRFSVRTS